jgi:hypothetical protein
MHSIAEFPSCSNLTANRPESFSSLRISAPSAALRYFFPLCVLCALCGEIFLVSVKW